MTRLFRTGVLAGIAAFAALSVAEDNRPPYLAGYLIIPTNERIEKEYNAGFSMFVPAWPLVSAYPGHRFQTGLPGTWMFAQYDGKAPKDLYSDVEGGLGWWTDTRFPTETPKFIMGGVGPNFSLIANGPAHGAGSWAEPRGLYGVAQLSPWLLFPIDGLNLRQGSKGDLFGYGYLNLPLCSSKATTSEAPVPTGGNSWTLFLSSKNFKGPVSFFVPHFWSQSAAKQPSLAGQLLDTRPSEPNRAVQMETQYIPCRMAKDEHENLFARIEPTSFPVNEDGLTTLVSHDTCYSKTALWESVDSWFKGGAPSDGRIIESGQKVRAFKNGGYATWGIRVPNPQGKETVIPIAWDQFAKPTLLDAFTYGYKWDQGLTTRNAAGLVTLPQYFKLDSQSDPKKSRWIPVQPSSVPAETGLLKGEWTRPTEHPQDPYVTPEDPTSTWKVPGPKRGPYQAHLGDGTIVTYYWYRFADQPALLNSDLSVEEREKMQRRVEKLHRRWTKDRDYLIPPPGKTLAEVDPAQLVKPPKGLEIGYVPIATRQELAMGSPQG